VNQACERESFEIARVGSPAIGIQKNLFCL
jgi:hypothetical protein